MSEEDFISLEEKEHFLSELHRFLAWVGEKPGNINIDGNVINLNDIIWNCIHKEQLSDNEKEDLLALIKKLQKQEEVDENILLKNNLSKEEAKRLYHSSAALIRAIMDLKECESGKVKLLAEGSGKKELKIDDTKRWLNFLKGVGKKFETS